MVFTMFIITDTIQVCTITDTIQVRTISNLVFPSKLEVHYFIARQADRRAITAQSYIQQRDDHRYLFTFDDRITA